MPSGYLPIFIFLAIAILFPTRGLYAMAVDSKEKSSWGYTPELAAAVARAYNNWLFDFCAPDPKRLLGTTARRCAATGNSWSISRSAARPGSQFLYPMRS